MKVTIPLERELSARSSHKLENNDEEALTIMDPLKPVFSTPQVLSTSHKNADLSTFPKPATRKSPPFEVYCEDDLLHFLPPNCLIPDCDTAEEEPRSIEPIKKPTLKPRPRRYPNDIWAIPRPNRKRMSHLNVIAPDDQEAFHVLSFSPPREDKRRRAS